MHTCRYATTTIFPDCGGHTEVVAAAFMPGPRPLTRKDSTSTKWTFLVSGIFFDTHPTKNVFRALEFYAKEKNGDALQKKI